MKKIFTLIALLSAIYSVNGQSFSLSKKVINVEGPNSTSEDAICTIKNISTDPGDTSFSWAILNYSVPPQWFITFCDVKDCYSGLTQGLSKSFNLKVNASGALKASFDFQNIQGTANMNLVVWSVKNTSNRDTVMYSATSWKTGINEIAANRTLTAYPNPVRDIVNIQYNTKEKVTIEIYNVLGGRVKSIQSDLTTTSVNVQDLENGMYFILIKDKNATYTKAFSKVN